MCHVCFLQVVTDYVQNTLAVQRLDLQGYMMLYVPAVDWIMQCLAYNSSEVGVVRGCGYVRGLATCASGGLQCLAYNSSEVGVVRGCGHVRGL